MCRVYFFLGGIIFVILIFFGLIIYLEKKSSLIFNLDKLVIYNWGDYIDLVLLKKFIKEIGIEV